MDENKMIQDVFAISASIKEALIKTLPENGERMLGESDIVLMELGVASALTDLFCAFEQAGGLPKRESERRFIEMLLQMVDEAEQQEGDEN